MSSTPEVSSRPNEEGNGEERVPRLDMVHNVDTIDEVFAYEDDERNTLDGDNVENAAQGTQTQTQ
ncbi:hypothetical protein OROGR_006124 [Orobanche gracilis]